MTFGADKRAQSTLVGFILLFGILVIAFSSYQAFVVPNQNAEVEFNHNQQVQTDMQELRNSLLDVRSVERIDEGEYEVVSEHRPVRVRTGTQYPARLAALNPPAPSGNLQASDPGLDFTIENAEVTNPDAYDGDPEGLLDDFETGFETRFLSYRPGYNEYQQAPRTGFEHSFLYNEFDNADLVVRNQRLINEKRLNVVLFSGDVSASGVQTVTLDPETLDGPTAPISIEAPNDNIEFTIPTERPELWASEDVIGEAFGEGATHARITDPGAADDRVTIELEAGETYQLRAVRVGFDGGSEENEFTPIQLEEIPPGEGEEGRILPGPSVTNAAHDGNEPLEAGDTFDLTADVSSVGQTGEDDWRGGTTIQAAEWYIEGNNPDKGEANQMEAVNGEYLNDVEVTVEDEVAANDLEGGDNTLIIRGQDSRGIWGEDTDSVTVEVEEEEEEDPPSFQINDVTITDANDDPSVEFNPGEEVRFEVDIENIGDETDTQDIDMSELIDSRNDNNFAGEVDPEGITLEGGEQGSVTLVWPEAENTHPNNNQDIDYDITIESEDDAFSENNAFTVVQDLPIESHRFRQ